MSFRYKAITPVALVTDSESGSFSNRHWGNLKPLANRLGMAVSVVNSLPEIDRAKKSLLAMMEGR